jgi:hypothetical protein
VGVKVGVGHGVGAMQHDKSIKLIMMGRNVFGNLEPIFRTHVGGIDQRIIFMDMKGRHLRAFEFGHKSHPFGQMARDRRVTVFLFLHTDGATGIGDVDFLSHPSIPFKFWRLGTINRLNAGYVVLFALRRNTDCSNY